MQYGFYVDASRCGSCKACVMACKDKNDTLVGLKYRNVIDYAGGSWSEQDGVMQPVGVFVYSISIACNHCAKPACTAVCPTGAMTKRASDGIVYVDESKCVACGACAKACPYGAPRLNKSKKAMGKCDFCIDYVESGGNPACVDACPMRCIEFGDIDELRAKHAGTADIAPLPSSKQTVPSIVIGVPSRAGQEGAVNNSSEELL